MQGNVLNTTPPTQKRVIETTYPLKVNVFAVIKLKSLYIRKIDQFPFDEYEIRWGVLILRNLSEGIFKGTS